ncbi:MAG: tetratricopeptide repeat protein [ANME-2 cluster archaeon]|nr:tetratricopeptide repeat protein [ANME-2 cluster archaeon]MBC2702069.1 tetratricopeptide repeat protein [ANME-2 cluster archaeon]MBC2708839.1 tetratricopeptide repeat protein [ANME-2 cluster archaeon]MBC2748206.1 tetratricopeptide repeat protein [ANME-2 cluster archaeon]
MHFLFPSSVPNFTLELGQLERPLVIPFDIPIQKRNKLLDLILYGLRKKDPILLELNWESIEESFSNQHRPAEINGLKLDENIIIATYINNEQQLNNYYQKYRRLPVLLTIAIITKPQVKTYRKWISQLKVTVVESVQKTIFDDKLLNPELFSDFPFNFALQNFEDPIDCMDFLNDAIDIRMKCDDVDHAIKTAFCELVANQFAELNSDEFKIIFSLTVTQINDEISNLTSFDETKILTIAQTLASKGFIHLYGDSLNPTAPIKKLSDADFFEQIGRILRKSMNENFKSSEKLYSKILISLRPRLEDILIKEADLIEVSASDAFYLDTSYIQDLIESKLINANLGDIISKLDDDKKIIDLSTTILWEETDENKRKALLAARSLAYLKENNPEKSLKDASKIKLDKNYNDIARILFLENSRLLERHGKWDYALQILEEALEVSKNKDKIYGILLDSISSILINKGDYNLASEKLNQALEIQNVLGDRSGIVTTLINRGNIHQLKGEYKDALDKYNEALEIINELGDRSRIATTLHNMGNIHQSKGEYDAALDKYNEALEIKNELGDRSGIADTINNIGIIHQLKGEYEDALEKYNEALEIKNKLGDRSGIADTINNIGIIHQLKGEYEDALEKYNDALEIEKELGDRSGIANTLGKMGNIHFSKGEYEDALEKYNDALGIQIELGERSGIATSLLKRGNIHQSKGEYDAALEKYNEALKIQNQLGERSGIATTLGNMGIVHRLKGEYDAALEKSNAALKIKTELGDRSSIAMTNAQLGVFYREKGDLLTSLVNFLTANRIFFEIGDMPNYLKSQMEIAATIDPTDISTIPDINEYLIFALQKVRDLFSKAEDETRMAQIDALISEVRTSKLDIQKQIEN